jgi:hypothetical protein
MARTWFSSSPSLLRVLIDSLKQSRVCYRFGAGGSRVIAPSIKVKHCDIEISTYDLSDCSGHIIFSTILIKNLSDESKMS